MDSARVDSRNTTEINDSHDPVLNFAARQSELIRRYRDCLILEHNPFGTVSKHWWHTARYAREILMECEFSLRNGRLPVPAIAVLDYRPDCTTDEERDQAAIQCIQAGRTLFRVIAEELCLLLQGEDGARRLAGTLTDLHAAIHRSLEKPVVELESVRRNQRNLSRELHDQVGNHVSLALRQLELLEAVWRKADERERDERFRSLKDTLVSTGSAVRGIVSGLRVDTDGRPGLQASLTSYLTAADASDLVVNFHIQERANSVDTCLEGALFIMLRECLRNIVSHANASQVSITADIVGRELVVRVEDDGAGFDPSVRIGNGLKSLHERAEELGGHLTIKSAVGSGTQISIIVPLDEVEPQ
ncbi:MULTISPECIES: sensor histidine kinase [Streptomyces]|uniref:Oxygen sensor histidine kinase NreB n=1 Tax=Streptomyces eurythermus TaxID=42237 RepID=A0ABW6Z655_9ACTN|nr:MULTISPECIES: ATP-binding protein [Streptomyces]QIS74053.1 hypothetical protein HB370_32060 [Streptomyces sp. DSM 40868]